MTPEILRYRIPADRQAAFLADYTAAGDVLAASPHCLGFELLQSEKDAELYLLTIVWDSAAGHLQGFRASADFARFLERVRPYIPHLLEMEHYAATAVRWRRPPAADARTHAEPSMPHRVEGVAPDARTS